MNVSITPTPYTLCTIPFQEYIFISIQVLLLLSNLLGNSLCIAVLARHRALNLATRLFLTSMTSCDLIIALTIQIPILGMTLYRAIVSVCRWPFGIITCYINGLMFDTLLTAGSFSIFAVNVDRFIAVIRPLRYHDIVTDFRAKICVVIIWLNACVCATVLGLVPGRTIAFYPRYSMCRSNNAGLQVADAQRAIWILTGVLGPLILTVMMCVKVFAVARRHRRQISAQTHDQQPQNKRNHKAFVTCFLMTGFLLLSTLPIILDAVVACITGVYMPQIVGTIAMQMLNTYCTTNFVIYYARNQDFRGETKALIARLNILRGH